MEVRRGQPKRTRHERARQAASTVYQVLPGVFSCSGCPQEPVASNEMRRTRLKETLALTSHPIPACEL